MIIIIYSLLAFISTLINCFYYYYDDEILNTHQWVMPVLLYIVQFTQHKSNTRMNELKK